MSSNIKDMLRKKFPDVDKLSKKEFEYFRILQANAGVLYVKGRPGEAKSAIFSTIAKKMGWRYEDIRLSQVDESEVGIMPKIREHYFEHIPPLWAYEASTSKVPTLVSFEELNRASLAVRNASLQILNERQVGRLKLPDNVYMVATGNLGDDDGTDTEELDTAVKNRLITFPHSFTLEDWKEGYANENVHQAILSFLQQNTENFYTKPDSNQDSFASARSWSNLSAFINSLWGKDSSPSDWIYDVEHLTPGYVGQKAGLAFAKHIKTSLQVTLEDILNKFSSVKDILVKTDNAIKSELLSKLGKKTLTELNAKQQANMISFLELLSPDEITRFFTKLTDSAEYMYLFDTKAGVSLVKSLRTKFKAEFEVIKKSTTRV